ARNGFGGRTGFPVAAAVRGPGRYGLLRVSRSPQAARGSPFALPVVARPHGRPGTALPGLRSVRRLAGRVAGFVRGTGIPRFSAHRPAQTFSAADGDSDGQLPVRPVP